MPLIIKKILFFVFTKRVTTLGTDFIYLFIFLPSITHSETLEQAMPRKIDPEYFR